jgi:hypothetical protein
MITRQYSLSGVRSAICNCDSRLLFKCVEREIEILRKLVVDVEYFKDRVL